jgi:hypothetical protein
MHSRRVLLYALVGLLVVAGLWFLVVRPIAPVGTADATTTGATPGGSAATSTAPGMSPTPGSASARASTAAGTCRVGTPKRLIIPALDVNAAFERIGLDQTVAPDAQGRRPLGNPTDRTKAGWYAAGPRPGSGTGTVLTNGHTYRNNSAIFKEDFASRIAVGELIEIRQDNGSLCSYRVAQVWREVNAKRDYPRIVTSEHLYDFTGPERLFLTTCGGSWNAAAQNYDDISLVIASPVNRG